MTTPTPPAEQPRLSPAPECVECGGDASAPIHNGVGRYAHGFAAEQPPEPIPARSLPMAFSDGMGGVGQPGALSATPISDAVHQQMRDDLDDVDKYHIYAEVAAWPQWKRASIRSGLAFAPASEPQSEKTPLPKEHL
jgi:hypothetical protein